MLARLAARMAWGELAGLRERLLRKALMVAAIAVLGIVALALVRAAGAVALAQHPGLVQALPVPAGGFPACALLPALALARRRRGSAGRIVGLRGRG
jgi:hypothetical protein